MSRSAEPNVLLVGGPDAGKSNFLFRFWLAVDSGCCTLIKDGFPDELQYLQTGSEMLLAGKFAGRTSGDVFEHATIPVKLAAAPMCRGVLNVPDIPGEQILEVYRLRQWTDIWESRIGSSSGCLLFMRAGSTEIVAPLDYETCLQAFGAPLPVHSAGKKNAESAAVVTAEETNTPARYCDAPRETVSEGNGNDGAILVQSTREEVPTEIVLTEWLQFLRAAFTSKLGGSFRPRVGIVVAAWDALPCDQQETLLPIEYVAQEYPLLAQFIETNQDEFDFQIFGVSIVSGDLTEDTDFRMRFIQGQPHEFGYVIHTLSGIKTRVSDVTLPVAWALGWHNAASESGGD